MLSANLIVTTLLALGLGGDNASLPAPTGPHKTGRVSFHWQDDSREELETAAPDDKRELMVHVFYPGTWVRAFLQGTVRGEWDLLKELSGPEAAKQEQMTVLIYGKLWP